MNITRSFLLLLLLFLRPSMIFGPPSHLLLLLLAFNALSLNSLNLLLLLHRETLSLLMLFEPLSAHLTPPLASGLLAFLLLRRSLSSREFALASRMRLFFLHLTLFLGVAHAPNIPLSQVILLTFSPVLSSKI